MPAGADQGALAALARSVLSLRPLIDALEPPLRVALPTAAALGGAGPQDLLDAVTGRLGAPRLTLGPGPPEAVAGLFARVLGESLTPALVHASEEALDRRPAPVLDRAVDEALDDSFERRLPRLEVRSFDGTVLPAYAAGRAGRPAVVLVSACGMPAKLCEPWLRLLAADCLVLTWESRGLFGDAAGFDQREYFDQREWDVAAQAADLVAVMDRFDVGSAHLMGMCGGTVIALAAAAAWPERASSLSLWHGDYELGPGCPKTDHQHDLGALLSMAAESRASATAVRTAMCRALLAKPLPELAPLVLYPYASAELAFRYGKLNGSIMGADVAALLPRVLQPVLVVTSEDDGTAHPAGSRRVAGLLPDATLHVEPHGDHLSLFRAEARVARLVKSAVRPPGAGRPLPVAC